MFTVYFTVLGPKVISKLISTSSIDELANVLHRPPVIWDNLHANDYDQRRLFLGPYDGRSTALIPKLNGVLTNPNCEYGANYVALYTLAHWSKCGPRSVPNGNALEVTSLYNPKEALNLALMEWMSEFQSKKRKCEDYLPAKTSASCSKATEMEPLDSKSDTGNEMVEDIEEAKERASSGSSSDMDTTPSHDSSMDHLHVHSPSVNIKPKMFELSDLKILVDYFYLPHVHGDKGQTILEEFCWLKHNAPGSKALKRRSLDDSGSSSNNSDDSIKKVAKLGTVEICSDGETSDDSSNDGGDLSHDEEQVC